MKNRLVIFLFGVVSACIVIFLILFFRFKFSNNILDLKDTNYNIEKVNKFKSIISNYENNNCNNSVKKLINDYFITSYNGKINLKEMYETDSFWENIVNVNNSCKNIFDSSTSDDINILIFSRMYLIENLYDKYIYKYNIRVKNNNYDSSVIDDNETYLSAKSLEVLIIDRYINAIININN